MTKKARKRKLGDEKLYLPNWDDENIFLDTVIREMGSMWEIPQIFHFLHLTKDVLNISHLSMFEMERMLLMPRASKQLANIMTSLLSTPFFKGRLKKLPPMPYEFWTNVLAHKVKSWFKVYEGKHRNPVKVLENIGVEPEFWTIFPDDSIFDGKDFEDLTFRQRVWLLKTVCDTLMHTRKKIQEETAKQPLENRFETVLGIDRHGTQYIYFPQFVKTDFRVYRHSLDNKVLSSVQPTRSKYFVSKENNSASRKSKRKSSVHSRLRSNSRSKRDSVTKCDDGEHSSDCKCSVDSGRSSLANDDTNLCSTSPCSIINRIDINTINVKRSRNSSKVSDTSIESSEVTRKITRSSGYDSATSIENSNERRRSQRMFKGFAPSNTNKSSIEILNGLLSGLKSNVLEDDSVEDPEKQGSWKTDDEKLNERINISKEETAKSDEEKLSENLQASPDESQIKSKIENLNGLQDGKMEIDSNSSSDCQQNSDMDSSDENDIDSLNELRARLQKEAFRSYPAHNKKTTIEYNLRKQKQDTESSESIQRSDEFNEILSDLGASEFELVADSVESLKELICRFAQHDDNSQKDGQKNHNTLLLCEKELLEKLKELLNSVEEIEPSLRESVRKARAKLQKEWTNINDGSAGDQESSGEDGLGSNWWIIGSQGYSVPSSSESTLQTVQETAISSVGADNIAGKPQNSDRDTNNTTANEQKEGNSSKATVEKGNDSQGKGSDQGIQSKDEKSDETRDGAQESRRVLRARGVSSYLEEFSSDDEFETKELEEWPNSETIDPTAGPQAGSSAAHPVAKIRYNSGLSNQEDSDKDWILPSSRKGKNRRPSASRRLKSFQHKIETIQTDMNMESPNSGSVQRPITPAVPRSRPRIRETKILKQPKPDEYNNSIADMTPGIANTSDDEQGEPITSVHSEIHIKEEPPVCDSTSSISDSNYDTGVSQSYVMVNANHAAMNYYVMQTAPVASAVLPQGTLVQAPSLVPAIMPQVEQGFYVQDGQSYIIPQPQAAFVSSPSSEFQMQSPSMMGTPQLVTHASYVPYMVTTAPSQMQSCISSPTLQSVSTLHTSQQIPVLPQPSSGIGLVASTPNKPSNFQNHFPHPSGAVIRSSMPIRGSTPRRGGGSRPVKTNRRHQQQPPIGQASPSGSTVQKTTSLICLSDSDDEIEMIIPESTEVTKSRVTPRKRVEDVSKSDSAPEAVVSVGTKGLPSDIMQRMSEAGITIIPIKPQTPTTNSNPPLVVVVNETGSHYALALPNGNKLILTPEQVAQIRAFNGGKLVP